MYKKFHAKRGLFGLRCDQVRTRGRMASDGSGWYNKEGERLGGGSLSKSDLRKIARGLEEGELFIILDAYEAMKGGEQPGVGYVANNARLVIGRNQWYFIIPHFSREKKTRKVKGLQCQVLTQDVLKTLMLSGATV